jgi:hypothetical protein
MPNTEPIYNLHRKELELLDAARALRFGYLIVAVQDGYPVKWDQYQRIDKPQKTA